MTRSTLMVPALAGLALLGGCAADTAGLTTSSVAPAPAQTAAKVDPQCSTLVTQIDTLRKDEAIARLSEAASGKTKSVTVKRASLAKAAELDRANADFQAKCGPQVSAQKTAQAQPAPAPKAP